MFVKTEGKVTLQLGNDIGKDPEIAVEFDTFTAKLFVDGEVIGTCDVEYMLTFIHVLQQSLFAIPSDD